MNSLFGDFFMDFWQGYLALDRRTGGGRGWWGGWGRGGEEKFMKNKVLQDHRDGEILYYSTTYCLLFNPYICNKSPNLF